MNGIVSFTVEDDEVFNLHVFTFQSFFHSDHESGHCCYFVVSIRRLGKQKFRQRRCCRSHLSIARIRGAHAVFFSIWNCAAPMCLWLFGNRRPLGASGRPYPWVTRPASETQRTHPPRRRRREQVWVGAAILIVVWIFVWVQMVFLFVQLFID